MNSQEHGSHWAARNLKKCYQQTKTYRKRNSDTLLHWMHSDITNIVMIRSGHVFPQLIEGVGFLLGTLEIFGTMLDTDWHPTIKLPFGDGLYHPFMVMFGMVYWCGCNIMFQCSFKNSSDLLNIIRPNSSKLTNIFQFLLEKKPTRFVLNKQYH